MVLASMQESEEVSWPPWEIAPCGVVSLLTMLDFSAKLYVEMSYQFGVMLANLAKIEANTTNWGDGLGQLIKDVKSLGLPVTYEQFNQMVIELIQANPGKVTYEDGQLRFKDMDINPQRFAHHLETLYST